MKEKKLDIAKRIIKELYNLGDCGLFNCRNLIGDSMCNIYDDGELSIDICYYYSYFEVFGLSESDFDELLQFYETLEKDET